MSGVRRLKRLIEDLDCAARQEIALAASEGRFDELPELTTIAKEIASLALRWPLETSPTPVPLAQPDAPTKVAAPVIPLRNATKQAMENPKKSDYPKFLREKHDLVKLGWSPRERGAYEHRVPKATVDTVALGVASSGKTGHRFTMDEVLKSLMSVKNSEQPPSYQVYAVMSWLKWAGMVLQHGRQGYTVVRPRTFASSIEAAWQSLPIR